MRTVLLAAALIGLAGPARAQSNGDLTQVEMIALNNFHHEMAECAAFYSIAIEGMKQRGNEETAARYQGISDALVGFMLIIGQKIGMKDETATARIRMAFDSQWEEMDQTFFNFSILLERYLYTCKTVFDDPESRMVFWIDKAADPPQ